MREFKINGQKPTKEELTQLEDILEKSPSSKISFEILVEDSDFSISDAKFIFDMQGALGSPLDGDDKTGFLNILAKHGITIDLAEPKHAPMPLMLAPMKEAPRLTDFNLFGLFEERNPNSVSIEDAIREDVFTNDPISINSPFDSVTMSIGDDAPATIFPEDQDPKSVAYKRSSVPLTENHWPNITADQLIHNEELIRRLTSAIPQIENGGYGLVDTYGQGEPYNTFHCHLLAEWASMKQNYPDYVEPRFENILKNPDVFLNSLSPQYNMLFHTEEFSGRFSSGSANRNLIFHTANGEGVLSPTRAKANKAVTPFDFKSRYLIQISFAIVQPDNPLYASGHALPDGRKFIVWAGKD